ncbi:MAG TPA: saccharopine dehydrogenase NADP-binding domain-containing protein [Kofleriaceae bacterium]|jgi:short subunit dehydrogenase-like uncharacterized protein|nr:saccharopine dehydrogenase NADP-binding domain-containing protein [Kofleriaceae bacterium]
MPTRDNREYDLVLLGATGFTGGLVAGYLAAHANRPLKWALVGRNRDRLEAVSRANGGVPVIVADALDAAAMAEVAHRTRVICTTAGPYGKYGAEVVAACAAAGTHYCDLTGEVNFMRAMIDAHDTRAKQTGAHIVHACGFDSIPSDLGTWAAQQEFAKRFGMPAQHITALFGEISGGVSGGTVGSALEIARLTGEDRALRKLLANPYALDPDPASPKPHSPDVRSISWNAELKLFVSPFVMADTNSRVVRRSHALAGFPWGDDFVYTEAMSAPGNAAGLVRAVATTGALAGLAFALKRPLLRGQLAKRAPQPGEGPDEQTRTHGHWKTRFVAKRGDDMLVYVAADLHGDPGYGSTMKMLGESALCLAFDQLDSPGGVTTPSVAMAAPLLERLRAAGLQFHPA